MSHWIWNRELFIFSPDCAGTWQMPIYTGINTHSNQRKSEAQISNSCKSLVTDTGKHNSAPNFEITNMSVSEHEGYRRALGTWQQPDNGRACLKRALSSRQHRTLRVRDRAISRALPVRWGVALFRVYSRIFWSKVASTENEPLAGGKTYVLSLVVTVCKYS